MKKYFLLILLLPFLLSCKKDNKIECSGEFDNAGIDCYSKNVNDSINGYVINYQTDSVTKESEGNYENGVQKGFWKFYYKNGIILKEGNFVNGQISGFWKLYYESGFTKEEGNYNNCERNGAWKFYYNDPTRKVESEGSFENGNKKGTWKYYDQNGKLVEERVC